MAKPREKEMGWSLKVGSKHPHFHERVTRVMPYMEICPDRLRSLTRGFRSHLINVINIATGICHEYIVINKEPTIIYNKKAKKDGNTCKKKQIQ